ncbi:asparaginase [Paralcaligenes ureilyticus]|uniref:L-asparaginase n=1 Tax=Paralcaligenes ureilyticus TaxID=627131 RepID=A0A4V2UY76_9BURK|nr:asparaginase [Paralcaligenes ureilyticus]TCT06328.1 L-asparaginase [Paralcaligenes ureilyticus]
MEQLVRTNNIVLLATGGTISMKTDDSGAAYKALGAASLGENLSGIPNVSIEAVDFAYDIGYSVTHQMMLALAHQITQLCERGDIDAVVVCHGTDVMEEVATFVDLTVASRKPIVFTGAMRNASMPGYDGAHNLRSAVQVAMSEHAMGRGVLVCMDDTVHIARAITKTHTSRTSTFDSPNFGAVGFLNNDVVDFKGTPPSFRKYALPTHFVDVPLIWVYAGQDTSFLSLACSQSKGIVIAAKGIGHVPAWWMPVIRQAIAQDVIVVVASQCGSGSTSLQYGGVGSDRDLLDAGVIFAGYRRPLQARIELMCAISCGLAPAEIRRAFASPFGLE